MLTKRERLQKTVRRARLLLSGTRGEARAAFVFGEMRSGTNMVIRTLSMYPDTECYLENDEEAFDSFVLRDDEVVSRLIGKSRAKVVAFKPIADSQNARKILDRHQGAKGVWIYRRYADAVNSALALWKEHKKYLHYMLHEPESAGWRLNNVPHESLDLVRRFYTDDLTDSSARALIWYIRNNLYFQQELETDPRMLLVNYERIVSDAEPEFQRIASVLGCRHDPRATRHIFSKSVKKRQPPVIDVEIRELCEQLFDELESALRPLSPAIPA